MQNTLVGVAYTDVNVNDGASRRNVVLRENGEFWVFGERKATTRDAGFSSGDTIKVEVDMDLRTVVFSRDGDDLCSAGHLAGNIRPFVALGNADALVSIQ